MNELVCKECIEVNKINMMKKRITERLESIEYSVIRTNHCQRAKIWTELTAMNFGEKETWEHS